MNIVELGMKKERLVRRTSTDGEKFWRYSLQVRGNEIGYIHNLGNPEEWEVFTRKPWRFQGRGTLQQCVSYAKERWGDEI